MSNIDIVIKIVSLIFMSSSTVFVVYSMTDYILRGIKSRRRKDEYADEYSWRDRILGSIDVLESNLMDAEKKLDDLETDVQYLQSGIFFKADDGPVSIDAITERMCRERLELLTRITALEHHIFPNAPEEQVKFNVADLEKRVKALEKKVKANE